MPNNYTELNRWTNHSLTAYQCLIEYINRRKRGNIWKKQQLFNSKHQVWLEKLWQLLSVGLQGNLSAGTSTDLFIRRPLAPVSLYNKIPFLPHSSLLVSHIVGPKVGPKYVTVIAAVLCNCACSMHPQHWPSTAGTDRGACICELVCMCACVCVSWSLLYCKCCTKSNYRELMLSIAGHSLRIRVTSADASFYAARSLTTKSPRVVVLKRRKKQTLKRRSICTMYVLTHKHCVI